MYEIGMGGIDRTHWGRCDMHIKCWVNFRERLLDVSWNIAVAKPSGQLSFTRSNTESRLKEFKTSCETWRIGIMRKIDKLSLCIIRWRVESGILAALTFNLCTTWKWTANFTHRPLYSRGNDTNRIGVCVGGTGGRFGCRIAVGWVVPGDDLDVE